MTLDETTNSFGGDEQDQELLDAIAAAFGADALVSLQAEDGSNLQPAVDLDQAVQQLDEAIYSQLPTQRRATHDENVQSIVAFQLGGTTYGLPMEHVTEIQRVPAVTNLPHVPDWVQGVANLRGHIVSVVDLRMLIGLDPTDAGSPTRRLVVIQSLVDEIDTGLVVDRVLGIRNISSSQIAAPTSAVEERLAEYLSGVVELEERLIVLLDVEKLLLSDVFRQFA